MSDKARDVTRARRIANALIVVATVLLLVMLWYSFWPKKDSSTPGSSTPPPRLSEVERRSANEALQALKALQSVTEAGVTYQEYSRRVLDAKIQVDRYLQTEGGDAEIKRSVQEAMDLYVLASSAWNAKITEDYEMFGAEHPAIKFCPPVKQIRDEAGGSGRYSDKSYDLMVGRAKSVSQSFQYLWGCASERIANLERAIKER